jgi:two-component system nitrogen regulation response regulator GlnG
MSEAMPEVWVVDDDASIRWVLDQALSDKPWKTRIFADSRQALDALSIGIPTVLVCDIRMPNVDGLTLMQAAHQQDSSLPVILMTAFANLDSAVSAYQGGAFEYLPKPFNLDEALSLIERAIAKRVPTRRRRAKEEDKQPLNIIGSAPAMQEVFRVMGRVAQLDVTVLINGETGTGKELIAKALHELSSRRDKPFVAINTAAIPRDLLESELFGHEKGAFTGALTQRAGRFEQADGGTLFLDEIGDMPIELQTRLLRVLNDGSFYRVGGHDPLRADVRILAATHQNMEKMVRDGKFREDLLYRLNIIRIQIPALRERKTDIPLILRYYMTTEAKTLRVDEKQLSSDVEAYLSTLDWPGNIRQLRSLCIWLTVMTPGKVVTVDDLPLELRKPSSSADSLGTDDWQTPLRLYARHFLQQGKSGLHTEAEQLFERVLIEETLQFTRFHRQETAALLGWGRNTLTRKSQSLGIEE